MKGQITYISFLFLLALGSCKPGNKKNEFNTSGKENETEELIVVERPVVLEKEEYIENVIKSTDQKLVAIKQVDDFEFRLAYEPWEALILKDREGNITPTDFKNEILSRNHFLYFTLKMKNITNVKELLQYDLASEEEYKERLNYYSFQVQNDLKMNIGSDTVGCSIAHFERTFGLSPELTLSLAFPINETQVREIGDKQLKKRIGVFFNEKIFNTGMINLSFHPNVINTIPELALK